MKFTIYIHTSSFAEFIAGKRVLYRTNKQRDLDFVPVEISDLSPFHFDSERLLNYIRMYLR